MVFALWSLVFQCFIIWGYFRKYFEILELQFFARSTYQFHNNWDPRHTDKYMLITANIDFIYMSYTKQMWATPIMCAWPTQVGKEILGSKLAFSDPLQCLRWVLIGFVELFHIRGLEPGVCISFSFNYLQLWNKNNGYEVMSFWYFGALVLYLEINIQIYFSLEQLMFSILLLTLTTGFWACKFMLESYLFC